MGYEFHINPALDLLSMRYHCHLHQKKIFLTLWGFQVITQASINTNNNSTD